MKILGSKAIRIYSTAFLGGVLTLGLEILAGRLLAPFFGSSMHQWAALIGVVLVAYVIGYELHHRINAWGPAIPFCIGGIYTLSLCVWLNPLLSELMSMSLTPASISGALIATGIPSIFWASVLPYLQKCKEAGSGSRVLAWSTAGNLAGVWGIAFIGIPVLGTQVTLMCVGGLSLLLALFWFNELKASTQKIGLVSAIVLSLWIPKVAFNQSHPNWSLELFRNKLAITEWVKIRDSTYQQILIWQGQVEKTARTLLMLNGNIQFVWNESEKLSPGERYEYYNYATAAAFWTEGKPARSMLDFGVAGGLIPWQMKNFLPQIEITGYELDSTLYEMSLKDLPLGKIQPPAHIKLGDGRFLMAEETKKFDLIVLDCFVSGYVPFHVTTQEFFELVRSRIAPGGLLTVNFHTIFAATGLLAKLEATMASVFGTVASLKLPSGITFVLASPEVVSFESRFAEAAKNSNDELTHYHLQALSLIRKVEKKPNIALLTDNHNDTEQLLYNTRKYVLVPALY